MLKDTDRARFTSRWMFIGLSWDKRSCRVYAETSGSYQGITYQGSCRIRPKWYDELEMIFKQMYANGIKDYFVELEQMPDGRTQFAGVKDCADYLIKAPFVK